jgi:multicomponent K+:H+ antiporter subunit E
MKRIFPFPLLSGVLFFCWLLLIAELSVAHTLLALILAWGIPKLSAPFLSHLPKVQSYQAALRLVFLVTWDIVVANVAVARLILGPRDRLRPAFIQIPLELKNPQSIVLLASIITMTPGTVSADMTEDRQTLIVHALDCPDPASMVADIKNRYEKPLMEIFGC